MTKFYIPTKVIVAINIVLALTALSLVKGQFLKQFSGLTEQEIKFEAYKLAEECRPRGFKCYEAELASLVKKTGLSNAEKTLYALQDIDPMTKSCHVISHFMAREALKKDPSNWKDLVGSVNVQACGSGFLHGVLEAHLGLNPSFKITPEFVDETCSKGVDPYRDRMCAHFIGHVALLEAEGDVDAALNTCRGIDSKLLSDCFNGLFMEDHQKLALAEHEISQLPDITKEYIKSLEQSCLKYNNAEGRACWSEMGEMYAKLYDYDVVKVYRSCYAAPAPYQEACYSKGVAILVTYPIERSSHQLNSICAPYAQPDSYKSCADHALSALFYYSPKFINRAITICLDSPQKDWCFNKTVKLLNSSVSAKEEREILCKDIPAEYKNSCIN